MLGRARGVKTSITLLIAVVRVSIALSISASDSRGWLLRQVTSSLKTLLHFSLFIIFYILYLRVSYVSSATLV